MNYLNKFKLCIVSALIILSSVLIFTGCGKTYKINISAEVPEGYLVSESEEVKANKPYQLYINADSGYSLNGVVVKINNSIVKGVIKANVDGEDIVVTDKTSIDHRRFWNYTINKVSSDTNIVIDFSDCGLIDCTVTLSNLKNQNAMYATYIGPEEHSSTVFNSQLISEPKTVVNNEASIKYGESLYVLLDENINLLKSNSANIYYPPLKKYADEHYQYYDKFVYFFRYVTDDFTITEMVENNKDNIYTTEKLATIDFRGTGSDAVNFNYYGDSLNNEPISSLSGSGLFFHSYMYIGDKVSFEDEQIESSIINEYLRIIGKKVYYRIYLNSDFYNSKINVKDVASFYLVEDIYQDTTNLSPLTIKEDDVSKYLEIEKSDIEQFILNETASLYLKTVIHNNILTTDYFGLKLNYLNDDWNTGVRIDAGEHSHHNPSYYEFLEDEEIIYYFHKSLLYNNAVQNDLNISFGKSDFYLGDKPYVDSTEFKVSRSNNIEAIYSKKFEYASNSVYVGNEVLNNHGIDLIGGIKNMFEITIKTTYQSQDISTHTIDFSEFFNSDYQATKPLFISNSIINPEWIELKETNLSKLNNLTISTTDPLYVYSLDYSSFPFDLYSNDSELVSGYSLITDIRGKPISINENDGSYNIYALILNKLYLPNEIQLHAAITNSDV